MIVHGYWTVPYVTGMVRMSAGNSTAITLYWMIIFDTVPTYVPSSLIFRKYLAEVYIGTLFCRMIPPIVYLPMVHTGYHMYTNTKPRYTTRRTAQKTTTTTTNTITPQQISLEIQ